jgi:hypothetical protein
LKTETEHLNFSVDPPMAPKGGGVGVYLFKGRDFVKAPSLRALGKKTLLFFRLISHREEVTITLPFLPGGGKLVA